MSRVQGIYSGLQINISGHIYELYSNVELCSYQKSYRNLSAQLFFSVEPHLTAICSFEFTLQAGGSGQTNIYIPFGAALNLR